MSTQISNNFFEGIMDIFGDLFANIFLYWLMFSGIIALILIIIVIILYRKNKDQENSDKLKKKYKRYIIILSIIVIQDILLWIGAIKIIESFFDVLKNNVGNLII